jgi:hypothetical protein
MHTLLAAVTGNYEPMGDPQEADCVIGQSFGAGVNEPGSVNEHLARFIGKRTPEGVPLILQSEIARAESLNRRPSMVVEGSPSTSMGGEIDSWEVLLRAHAFMKENGLRRPLLVAQAYHIGRVSVQAVKQGMEPIVPAGLPRLFDPNSIQPWTRSAKLWALREVPGMAYLRFRHKL